jgi:malate dehydrogenase (oxaloacetate-decarboxylating)
MKVAAAHALAGFIKRPQKERILPQVLNRRVVKTIAQAVSAAAIASGCTRVID